MPKTRTFVCREKGFLTDFVPPFVHPGASGDFFVKPPHVVYTIWAVYVAALVLIPGVISWLLVRMHQRALNRGLDVKGQTGFYP